MKYFLKYTLRFLLIVASLCPLSVQGQQADSLLKAGPMVGYGGLRSTGIWVQTTDSAFVRIRYWNVNNPDSTLITPPEQAVKLHGYVADFEIGYLEPGQTYAYEVVINGEVVERPYPTRFQTQPLWQWRTAPPTFTVAIGSCAYINDPGYERPGDPYGGKYFIFKTIAKKNPEIMLWLGDNVYYREVDLHSPVMMNYRYSHTRSLSEMQPLLASTHNYAIWDDHDYGPNNANRSWHFKAAALKIFKRYWMNPSAGLPGVPGIFTKFTWGDVAFFLLDDRFYRTPAGTPPEAGRAMLGEAQLQWLIDALTSSNATFKIIVSGNQMLNPATKAEAFIHFPQERQRLLNAIAKRNIEGVIFLSGDRHFTTLSKLPRSDSYPLYDFTSSPLTSEPYDPGNVENPFYVEGTLVTQRNFGTLTFSGPRGDRTLTLRTYDAKGNLLWKYVIEARDLRVHETE